MTTLVKKKFIHHYLLYNRFKRGKKIINEHIDK